MRETNLETKCYSIYQLFLTLILYHKTSQKSSKIRQFHIEKQLFFHQLSIKKSQKKSNFEPNIYNKKPSQYKYSDRYKVRLWYNIATGTGKRAPIPKQNFNIK